MIIREGRSIGLTCVLYALDFPVERLELLVGRRWFTRCDISTTAAFSSLVTTS